MKLLSRILNRIAFIQADFATDGNCRTQVFLWRTDGMVPADRTAAKNTLAVLVVCGHGVITKPDGSQITARIKADSETFMWSSVVGRTSFVRRERLGALTEELAAEGIVPVRIFCAAAEANFETLAGEFARQVYADLRWRSLVCPTAESSTAAQAVVQRAALPVLGLFLYYLVFGFGLSRFVTASYTNAVFFPRLNARRQALQQEIAARERTASNAASAGARQRELLAEFSKRPAAPWAVVCDRVTGAVPERVVLTQLAVEPLTNRFEARKPLQRLESRVVICGTAPKASDVSAFVRRLSEETCCRDVRLMNVEKERDGDRLSFRIETAL